MPTRDWHECHAFYIIAEHKDEDISILYRGKDHQNLSMSLGRQMRPQGTRCTQKYPLDFQRNQWCKWLWLIPLKNQSRTEPNEVRLIHDRREGILKTTLEPIWTKNWSGFTRRQVLLQRCRKNWSDSTGKPTSDLTGSSPCYGTTSRLDMTLPTNSDDPERVLWISWSLTMSGFRTTAVRWSDEYHHSTV